MASRRRYLFACTLHLAVTAGRWWLEAWSAFAAFLSVRNNGMPLYARVMRPLIALSSDARALPAVSVSSRQDRLKERLASEHQGPERLINTRGARWGRFRFRRGGTPSPQRRVIGAVTNHHKANTRTHEPGVVCVTTLCATILGHHGPPMGHRYDYHPDQYT